MDIVRKGVHPYHTNASHTPLAFKHTWIALSHIWCSKAGLTKKAKKTHVNHIWIAVQEHMNRNAPAKENRSNYTSL